MGATMKSVKLTATRAGCVVSRSMLADTTSPASFSRSP